MLIAGRAVFQRRGEYKGFESCLFFFLAFMCFVVMSCINLQIDVFFLFDTPFSYCDGLEKDIHERGTCTTVALPLLGKERMSR